MCECTEPSTAATVDDPFSVLSDTQLWDATYSVILQCLRSKGGINRDHSKHACALLEVMQLEHKRRGTKPPQPPYSA